MPAPASAQRGGTGRLLRNGLLLGLFGALVYGLSLVVTAPARLIDRIVPRPTFVEALTGTIWNGRAAMRDGHSATWRFDTGASLRSFALAYDVEIDGPATRLTARADVTRNRMVLHRVEGRTGWSLVTVFMPGEITCTPVATVDLSSVTLSRRKVTAEGTLRSTAGTCTQGNHQPVPVPPLIARATGERAVLTTIAGPDTPLAGLTQADGIVEISLHPEGLRRVPGLPASGPMVLEFGM